jgi:2-polyprenyl-3-methyl-5-hydroxy-6-metoxy-1,4-benzoquinol methylase
MQEHPWFKDWFNSKYYYQLYFKRDDKEAAAFIDNLVTHLAPPKDARILDVACGRGRHSIHLSEKGFDVTGIDLSEDSIKEALLHETEKLHFYQHDMRQPFRINYFDYAFNFFTSFGYFKTRREHDNSIRMIAQSLKSNGSFVLDYLNVRYAEDHLVTQSTKQIDDTYYHLTKWQDKDHFYKKIRIEDKELQQPLEYTETVAKFSLGDFKKMFACNGLHIKEVFGDYNLGSYDPIASARLIIVATK